jgi:hypothetical protein
LTALTFSVTEIIPDRYAATPLLCAQIHLEESTGALVHAMALRCQVRIAPQRRQYESSTGALGDLFGTRDRWGSTLKPLLWMHASTTVRGFTDGIDIELPLPCTYDLDVAATKYLHAVRGGDIPLSLMFNGTIFTRGDTGFQVEQIPWNTDVEYRMPTEVWHDMMDAFFPNSGWIRMSHESIDALVQFRTSRGLTGWDETFETLLRGAPAVTAPGQPVAPGEPAVNGGRR